MSTDNNPEEEGEKEKSQMMHTVQPSTTRPKRGLTTVGRQSSNSAAGKVKAKRKRRLGKLAQFLDLPIDVFLEIAAQAHPLDLLHLARVSKWFRGIFLNRRNRAVWVRSLQNVPGLPDCPSNLTEPRYAALMFTTNCFSCGGLALSPKMTFYALGVRLCGTCGYHHKTYGSLLLKDHGVPEELNESILELLPCCQGFTWSATENAVYSRAEFAQVLERYRQLESDPAAHQAFVEERKAFVLEIHTFNNKAMIWAYTMTTQRREDARKATESREKSIMLQLKALGYLECEMPRDDKAWRKLVEQPRELTPRIWERIRPLLEAIIQDQDQEHIRLDRNVYKRTVEARKFFIDLVMAPVEGEDIANSTMPNLIDACKLPTMAALINENAANVPITKERFLTVIDGVKRDVRIFKIQVKRDLTTMLENTSAIPADLLPQFLFTDELLQLDIMLGRPSSLFYCLRCSTELNATPMGYPEIYDHWRRTHDCCSWFDKVSLVPDNAAPQIATCRSWIATGEAMMKALKLGPNEVHLMALDELVRAGRLVCTCDNPAIMKEGGMKNWGFLVAHVADENQWYQQACTTMNPSLDDQTLVLRNDHDLTMDRPCIQILSSAQARARRREELVVDKWTLTALNTIMNRENTIACGICFRITGSNEQYLDQCEFEPDVQCVIHHVKTKHLQMLSVNDIIEIED